jgi:hypothetical protein
MKGNFQQALAALTSIVAAHAVKCWDPEFTKLGDPHDLNNYLPGYGATQHMERDRIWDLKWPIIS